MNIEAIHPDFDFEGAVARTLHTGYSFGNEALAEPWRRALEDEIGTLTLKFADHVEAPINAGQPNEVKQQHERAYFTYGDPEAPIASELIDNLAQAIHGMTAHPDLSTWQASEIGYQRYQPARDWIGPHRDRASDEQLSITFTLTGAALIKIFEPIGDDPFDYSQLNQVDEAMTSPGSIMLLRAPGFGNGEQIVHEVLPPTTGSRSIINLRMRPTILPQPK